MLKTTGTMTVRDHCTRNDFWSDELELSSRKAFGRQSHLVDLRKKWLKTSTYKKKLCVCRWLVKEERENEVLIWLHGMKRAEIRPIFIAKNEDGLYETLIKNYLREDNEKFIEYFRISVNQFDYDWGLIKNFIPRQIIVND